MSQQDREKENKGNSDTGLDGGVESGVPQATAPDQMPAAELRQTVEDLKEQLAACQKQFLYERAEVENFKRRLQRDKAESLRYAVEPLVRDLLPIVDNLERAIAHGDASGESVIEGVRMVRNMLVETLARHNVNRIESEGEKFDPAKHQAIAQVESAEHPANHVSGQHLVGYQLHDRLLRPAMVTVSSGKLGSPVETPDNSD